MSVEVETATVSYKQVCDKNGFCVVKIIPHIQKQELPKPELPILPKPDLPAPPENKSNDASGSGIKFSSSRKKKKKK